MSSFVRAMPLMLPGYKASRTVEGDIERLPSLVRTQKRFRANRNRFIVLLVVSKLYQPSNISASG